ncbi:secretory lipase-domain-containing protein [Gongronella butleri]|nr:secretory lipase-domain-containing protein [Gongronella butleri]
MEVASNATSTTAPSNGTATASGNATAPAPATTSNGGDLYTPPSGIESAAPGAIVQIIPLNGSLAALSIFPQKLKSVHLIQYRTTDGNGQATTSVTTLIEPYNADPSKLVSYQMMEDSADPNCAPSRVMQEGSKKGLVNQAEVLFIDTLLDRGYYVTVPDYEGNQAQFTVGANAGHLVLDGIRASLLSGNQTNLRSDAQVQLWGYSGGALAGAWAAQLQPTYAPELSKVLIGAALGGTPVNLNATLNAVNKSLFSGFIPAGILGLMASDPALTTYVDSILLPEKRDEFYAVRKMCLAEVLLKYPFQDIKTYIKNPDVFMADPVPTKALNTNNLALQQGHPTIPLFMYHSKMDEVVPLQPALDLRTQWCGQGTNIAFTQDLLSEHAILFISGSANAVSYLDQRFKGQAAPNGCTFTTTASSALSLNALNVFGQQIYGALLAILGQNIGPGHW